MSPTRLTSNAGTGILPRRGLGRTDLSISALGFSASPLGDVFSVTNRAEALAGIEAILAQVANYILPSDPGENQDRLNRPIEIEEES
uniref:Uncharacterized protein n=1 Tax=mine drainage metagenome TaxID=410659 RepID=E6PWZ8_9ZZZZ